MPTEINCFKIHGLEQLEAEYGIYQLAGLRRDSAEFFANVQRITIYASSVAATLSQRP